MRVMERLKDINLRLMQSKRVLALLLAISLTLSLTSCTMQALDTFRPEINISNAMIDSTNVWDTGYELTETGGTTPDDERESGTEVTGPGTGTGEADIELNSYSPIPYDVVSSSDYTMYLREKVYLPVEAALKERQKDDSGIMSKIYFRVYHIGYNRARDDSDMDLVRSAAYNMKLPASPSVNTIGGNIIPDYMYSYLMKRYDNQQLRDRQVDRLLTSLEGYDDSLTAEQARLDENFPSNMVSMWLSERNKSNCATLADFKRFIKSSPNYTVPGLKLSVLTGASTSQYVVFNDLSTQTRRTPYQGGMSRYDFDKIFTPVSQFTSSTYDIELPFNGFDDQSICWAYIDKYSVTFISLACKPGTKLKDLLGDQWYDIYGIITATARWSNIEGVKSAVGEDKEVAVIEKGLRGR